MSQPNFGHLKKYKPQGQTEFLLPIRASMRMMPTEEDPEGELIEPSLTMCCAGQTNKGWFDAISKSNTKKGAAARLLQGGVNADTIARNRNQDRHLFPKFVITGWAGICDADGNEVEFSKSNCTDFLASLPDWIMDEIRNFAAVPANFIPDEDPTDAEIQETAGN